VKVDGDVPGLRAIARSLTGVVPEIIGSGEAVSKRVDALVGDAGWSGTAAEEFKGAWEQDSAAIVELSGCVKIVGICLNDLANGLESAQRRLDRAVSDVKDARVPVAADGSVPEGVYPADVIEAMQRFSTDSKAAMAAAQDARDAASETLHAIAGAITGESADDTSFLKPADAAVLASVLRGYYTIPNELSAKAAEKLADFNNDFKTRRLSVKSTPGNSAARAALKAELPGLRQLRKGLTTNLESAEKVADRFKGGRLLNTKVGDLAKGVVELEDAGRLSKLLDSLPGVDVVVAGLATWAQSKEDHEKGWSWTHAILADGGSNVAGLAAGVGADFIPGVGPFVAPFIGYGVGAFTYEATHEAHWTEHIHEDGVFNGLVEGTIDSGKTTWNVDVIEMGKKLGNDAVHPVSAAKSLWQGVQGLV
jgi:uncharacterized protein YukE